MPDDPQQPGRPQHPPPGGESAEAEAGTLYGHAGTVTFFTLLSRVLGLARDLVIAHIFGASAATDAWVQAFRIPNALRRLTAEGAMTIAFVPAYVQVRGEGGPEAARAFAQRVLGVVLTVTLVLCALGMVFNEPLMRALSPGFAADARKFSLAADLLRWTFPYLVLVSLVAWAMGVLNAEGRFAAPAAAPMFLNLGIIGAVVGAASLFTEPVMAIALGVLVGGVVQAALQVPDLLRVGVWPRPRGGWRGDEPLARLMRLLAPALLGVAVYQINIIVLGVIASFLPTGQIFHYNNATRLTELVMGLFAFAFATAGQPTLSRHWSQADWPRLRATLALTFSATLYAILPAMAGLIAAGPGIVAMLYLHGAFGVADARSTADALAVMALGMPAVALVRVMVPVFYAFSDSRTPVWAAVAALAATAALGWELSRRYEVVGLAAGLSLGMWFQCAVLALVLRRRAAPLGRWFPWTAVGLQGIAALLMGLAVNAAHGYGLWAAGPASLRNWAVLTAMVGGGALLYFGLTLWWGEPQAAHWLGLLRRLGARLRRLGRRGG